MSEVLIAFVRRSLCRLFGHRIGSVPWRYEQGQTWALVGLGESQRRVQLPCTWACCEECSRCGLGVWTPW